MKALPISFALIIGWFFGYFSGTTYEMRQAKKIIASACEADGFSGDQQLRHKLIGGIQKVWIDTNIETRHLEVVGTKGSRQWWP